VLCRSRPAEPMVEPGGPGRSSRRSPSGTRMEARFRGWTKRMTRSFSKPGGFLSIPGGESQGGSSLSAQDIFRPEDRGEIAC
jgi:hypothetical protein